MSFPNEDQKNVTICPLIKNLQLNLWYPFTKTHHFNPLKSSTLICECCDWIDWVRLSHMRLRQSHWVKILALQMAIELGSIFEILEISDYIGVSSSFLKYGRKRSHTLTLYITFNYWAIEHQVTSPVSATLIRATCWPTSLSSWDSTADPHPSETRNCFYLNANRVQTDSKATIWIGSESS